MTLMTLTLASILLCVVLCALIIASWALRPSFERFLAITGSTDSLQTRVIPMLAFIGLLAVMTKLTLF